MVAGEESIVLSFGQILLPRTTMSIMVVLHCPLENATIIYTGALYIGQQQLHEA